MPPLKTTTDELVAALEEHNVQLDVEHHELICRYCRLLWKWNNKLNLTRHTDYQSFVTRDLIDSLRLSTHIPADRKVLDVGSGGGVPGVILAVTRPDLTVCLAESVGKKARALSSIVGGMKLDAKVHSGRAEDLLKKKKFDVMTLRAVASLRKLLFWFQKQSRGFDQMLLIKGPRWESERDEAAEEGLLDSVELQVIDSYATPGHDNDSVILSLRYETV